jgi:hypothetical protein
MHYSTQSKVSQDIPPQTLHPYLHSKMPSTPKKNQHPQILLSSSSSKDLDNTIAACTYDKPAILTPGNVADTLAPHRPVGDDVLGADTLFQRPESDTCVVAGGNSFPAIFGEGEGGDCGGVGEHGVSCLTWVALASEESE